MIAPTAEALWQYSLRLYSDPTVSAACLELQDECGADVNMLFALLFAASRGLLLSHSEVSGLDRECEGWRESVIEPLRRVRRLIKNDELRAHCDVYQQVKKAELLAERRHQFALAAALERIVAATRTSSPHDAARLNLQAYLPLQNARSDRLAILLRAYARDLSLTGNPPT